MSDKLMEFCPATGRLEKVYPSHAAQWRAHYGNLAWLFNPWTGQRRDARDVGSDPFGLLIVHPDEPIKAAPGFTYRMTGLRHDGTEIPVVDGDTNIAEPLKAAPAPAPEQAPAEPVGKPDLTRCRERLRLAGLPYPKSSCEVCGPVIGDSWFRPCFGRMTGEADHHPV